LRTLTLVKIKSNTVSGLIEVVSVLTNKDAKLNPDTIEDNKDLLKLYLSNQGRITLRFFQTRTIRKINSKKL